MVDKSEEKYFILSNFIESSSGVVAKKKKRRRSAQLEERRVCEGFSKIGKADVRSESWRMNCLEPVLASALVLS